ncbi:MAG: hypothetical protein IIC88_00815 [Chloroflexi bacterium]|nr:hypothetical protein [Chloroflexota bacterium]
MVPPLRSAAFSRRTALGLGLLALLALSALAACNGGNGDVEPTATEPEATAPAATATAELPRNAFEQGKAPIFWQPLDEGFESLRVGEPYKVLFRVTSGYAEKTLPITVECSDCAEPVPGGRLEFEPLLAQTEGEAPGSYYPFSLDLPQPGTWLLTVTAGDDTISITVEVKPAAG